MQSMYVSRCRAFINGRSSSFPFGPYPTSGRPIQMGGRICASDPESTPSATKDVDLERELNKIVKQTATTFAPRASVAKPNPAFKGSLLYDIFEWQAWLSMAVGAALSFNVLYPTDEPSIPRLLGMWSVWMFTVPSLRARECTQKEKDALNLLFIGIPLLNVTLPFLWKSFPFIFTADCLAVFGAYYWKGVWREVYGFPFGPESTGDEAAPAPSSSEEKDGN